MFALVLHLSALAGLTANASNDICLQAGFFSMQESAANDTSTVEEIDLPDWMPIDSRGEWEHLYTRRLPSLQEDTQSAEARQRELAILLAEAKEAGDAKIPVLDDFKISSWTTEIADLEKVLERLTVERNRVENRLNQLTSLLHWPNPKYWALHHGPGIGGIFFALLLGQND